MRPERYEEVFELFLKCQSLPPDEQRGLIEQCTDPELRAEVQALLNTEGTTFAGDAFDTRGAIDDGPSFHELFSPPPSLVGERLDGLLLEKELGRGGMGVVYAAYDERLDRRVAVKVIGGNQKASRRSRERFSQEARSLSQLEHPHICRLYNYVETGESEYLVLELIEGRPLSEFVSGDELNSRERLRLAAQVADALGAAHAKGIVHRDVKPDNVMVASDGTARVLDFGLARRRDHWNAPEEAHAGGSREGSRATIAGSLIGTPGYMSPEQARAEEATAASDMYSFGILLQELLTRRPAYPPNLQVHALIAWASLGEIPPEGLPASETELISELKSMAPTARPTALETARRLRSILDRPRRRRRMVAGALIAAAGLAGAIKYTFDLRYERSLALAAEKVADSRRAQAESLIDFMLGGLREQLTAVGKLDILDNIGDEALDYFAAVPEEELSRSELARRAKALYQIGEVRIEQARLDAANVAFAEALSLSQRLVELEPDSTEWLSTLGNCHFWVGNGHFRAGRLEDALREFEAYRALAQRLVEIDPNNPDWRMEVAHGEGNVAHALQALRRDEPALEALHRRSALIEDLLLASPDRTDWLSELATTATMIGIALESRGEYVDAMTAYGKAVDTLVALAASEPEVVGWKEQLSTVYSYVGGAHTLLGHEDAARKAFQESSALAAELLLIDPGNAYWIDIRAIAEATLAHHDQIGGDPRSARERVDTSLSTYSRLAGLDPDRIRWQLREAEVRLIRAKLLLRGGDSQSALADARAACASMQHLSESGADERDQLRIHCEALLLASSILEQDEQRAEAEGLAQEAWNKLEPHANSRDGRLLIPLVLAARKLDRTRTAQGALQQLQRSSVSDPRL